MFLKPESGQTKLGSCHVMLTQASESGGVRSVRSSCPLQRNGSWWALVSRHGEVAGAFHKNLSNSFKIL